MGPIWGQQDPGGPRFGPMIFVNWVTGYVSQIFFHNKCDKSTHHCFRFVSQTMQYILEHLSTFPCICKAELQSIRHDNTHRHTIQTQVWGPFYEIGNSYSIKISYCFHPNCTWHERCAVVTCLQFCYGMISYNGVTLQPILHLIWMRTENRSCNGLVALYLKIYINFRVEAVHTCWKQIISCWRKQVIYKQVARTIYLQLWVA